MYIYEMHQHTAHCSGCGRDTPEKLIPALKRDGIAGVVLTNHFYHGNTGIDRSLPWEEFCKPYKEDYELAVRLGDELGVQVFFGIEEGIGKGKEVLIYGLTPEFIFNNPQLVNCSLAELYEAVHKAGGLVIQAHPFRARDYIEEPNEIINPDYLDGYEIFNRCNQPSENERAKEHFANTGKIQTAGSDSHVADFENRCGIASKRRIKDEKDLTQILLSGKYELYIP